MSDDLKGKIVSPEIEQENDRRRFVGAPGLPVNLADVKPAKILRTDIEMDQELAERIASANTDAVYSLRPKGPGLPFTSFQSTHFTDPLRAGASDLPRREQVRAFIPDGTLFKIQNVHDYFGQQHTRRTKLLGDLLPHPFPVIGAHGLEGENFFPTPRKPIWPIAHDESKTAAGEVADCRKSKISGIGQAHFVPSGQYVRCRILRYVSELPRTNDRKSSLRIAVLQMKVRSGDSNAVNVEGPLVRQIECGSHGAV